MIEHRRFQRRRGLTLTELVIAGSVTAMIVAAVGQATRAVLDGIDHSSEVADSTQTGRVVLSRISHQVESSVRVLELPDNFAGNSPVDPILMVWLEDGGGSDQFPDQPSFNECLLYLPGADKTTLLEVRPQLAQDAAVPSDSASLRNWINRFRQGFDVEFSNTLVEGLSFVGFRIDKIEQPNGMVGFVQQNVRVLLATTSTGASDSVHLGTATRRFKADPEASE